MFLQETKSDSPPAHVDHLSKGKGKGSKKDMKKKKKPPKSKNGKTPEAQCLRCLGQLHPKTRQVRESKFNKCSRVGHLAKACKYQSGKREREVNCPGRQEEEKGFFIRELTDLDAVQEVQEIHGKLKFH